MWSLARLVCWFTTGMCSSTEWSRPRQRPRPRLFFLELSSRSRTVVLEDPILGSQSIYILFSFSSSWKSRIPIRSRQISVQFAAISWKWMQQQTILEQCVLGVSLFDNSFVIVYSSSGQESGCQAEQRITGALSLRCVLLEVKKPSSQTFTCTRDKFSQLCMIIYLSTSELLANGSGGGRGGRGKKKTPMPSMHFGGRQ